jgi:hypothetical protein
VLTSSQQRKTKKNLPDGTLLEQVAARCWQVTAFVASQCVHVENYALTTACCASRLSVLLLRCGLLTDLIIQTNLCHIPRRAQLLTKASAVLSQVLTQKLRASLGSNRLVCLHELYRHQACPQLMKALRKAVRCHTTSVGVATAPCSFDTCAVALIRVDNSM